MGYTIVGVSACTAGIAHTYMAAQSLVDAGVQRGDSILIETQGALGAENILTKEDIERADVVLIASDVDVDLTRFLHKRIYKAKTIDAIKDASGLIERAIKEAQLFDKRQDTTKKSTRSHQKSTILSHILNGMSYMGLLCIVAGLLFALSSFFANKDVISWSFQTHSWIGLYMHKLYEAAGGAFQLAIPLFAGFLAKSIGDKPAIAPAMIASYMANQPSFIGSKTGGGFLCALLIAILVGYFIKFIKQLPWPSSIAPTLGFVIFPFVTTLLILFLVVFVIGKPIAMITQVTYQSFGSIVGKNNLATFFIGALLGGMMGFDFGGSVNKIAMLIATAVFADTINIYGIAQANFIPQTATQAAICIAPMSMWISLKFKKHSSTKEELSNAKQTFWQGMLGVNEGVLFFTQKKHHQVVFSSVCGSALTGGLVCLTGCKFYGGIGSIIGTFVGYVAQPIPYITWMFCIGMGILLCICLLLIKVNVKHKHTNRK